MKIVEYKAGHEDRLAKLDVSLSNPLSLCWQITKRCNYKCPFCLCGTNESDELPFNAMQKIIDILNDANLVRIDFTGGEPLLRADFCEILTYASDKGIETLVTSNGSIWSRKIAQTLIETNTLLLVSIDGDEKTHDRFRGKGAYKKAVTNVMKYHSFGVPIRINCLIHKENTDQINYVYELVKSLGINRLFYILIAPQGRAYSETDLLLTDEERSDLLAKLKIMKHESGDSPFITIQDYSTLGNYHSCFLIDSKGDVISQGYTQDECIRVGNILTDGLSKCWNNPAVNQKGHFLQYSYMFNYYM